MEGLIGTKPKAIRTLNTTTFTIEVDSVEQSTAMQAITEINGINTEISVNTTFYKTKGLIYIYDYNMSSFQAFQSRLKEQYGLHEVVEATWIKARNNNRAKPLLLTFCTDLPQYIDVPGELIRTKVYEYKQQPLMCKRCLKYGHGVKHCEKEQRCAKCSADGHERNECKSMGEKCVHCGKDHQAGERGCIEQK